MAIAAAQSVRAMKRMETPIFLIYVKSCTQVRCGLGLFVRFVMGGGSLSLVGVILRNRANPVPGAVGLFVRFVMAERLASGRGGDFAKQSQFDVGRIGFVCAVCDGGLARFGSWW